MKKNDEKLEANGTFLDALESAWELYVDMLEEPGRRRVALADRTKERLALNIAISEAVQFAAVNAKLLGHSPEYWLVQFRKQWTAASDDRPEAGQRDLHS